MSDITVFEQRAANNGMKFVHKEADMLEKEDLIGVPFPTLNQWHLPNWLTTDGSPTMYVFTNVNKALPPVAKLLNKMSVVRIVANQYLNPDDVVVLMSD